MESDKIYQGDCIKRLKELKNSTVDLIYFDPPFFTQKSHSLKTRDNSKKYEFNDSWDSLEEYLRMINSCLIECKRVLKDTGNIFLHCDKIASHYIRVELDKVFGREKFRSEIIWSYKRWSNSKKGLLNAHQNIYYYSKTDNYKFNLIYTDYAPTTNLDQILQERERSKDGKAVYKTDENGKVILGKEKKGVPLSDTWEIPFLNPKAKERVGYPTQKPVLLLKQIIKIASDEDDLVVDPFCGSGTTCVAAKDLGRKFIGIDISKDAVALSRKRLKDMVITDSHLLKKGSKSYIEKSDFEMEILKSIGAHPVQRNKGVDGLLKRHFNGKPVVIKLQKKSESLEEAITLMLNSAKARKCDLKIVIQTSEASDCDLGKYPDVTVIKTLEQSIDNIFKMELIKQN